MAALVEIAALLLADDGDFLAVDTSKSANNGWVIGISSIAVYLLKISKNRGKNVQRIRPVGMPRTLNTFESGD